MLIGKRTAVIGGRGLALRALTELSLNAEAVHLIAESPDILETPLKQRLATNLKVTLGERYRVKEIQGTASAERIIMAAEEGGTAEIDEQGRVKVDNSNRISCTGLYAAGDVANALAEQVLFSVGEGAKAALSAMIICCPPCNSNANKVQRSK